MMNIKEKINSIPLTYTLDDDYYLLNMDVKVADFKEIVLDPAGVTLEQFKEIQKNIQEFQFGLDKRALEFMVENKPDNIKITGYEFHETAKNDVFSVHGIGKKEDNVQSSTVHLTIIRPGTVNSYDYRIDLMNKLFADVNN